MHQQNACLYLAETTWLFTQLWASLQSGEADGGQTGIRTLETVTRLHTFQACAFDHSATCPYRAFTPLTLAEQVKNSRIFCLIYFGTPYPIQRHF